VLRGHPGHLDARDTDRIVAQMNRVNADMVLVSLPTPMQQEWVAANRDKIHASLVMTSGSLLDHVADNRDWPRSWYPTWANRLGLNWLSRLVREPRRLWRRYTIEMIDFAWLVLRARARR
jgi:N-acetylglucosaminyldiphosphoundecaprenol N-acetyl-beta-D-mannosaminyltransferase